MTESKPKKLAWYQSLVTKAALVASAILLAGYFGSLGIGLQGINAISSLAYDEEIEQALAFNLEQIKKSHKLQQKVIVLLVQPKVEAFLASDEKVLSKELLKDWFVHARMDEDHSVKDIIFQQLSGEILQEQREPPIKWVSRQELRVLNYRVEYPKGKTYSNFRTMEDLGKRYQLIGVQLTDDIQPAIFKANAIILLLGFIILGSAFFVIARNFKRSVQGVLKGFEQWGEGNFDYRFDDSASGELRLITGQFNEMAELVEKNRQRSLYLEKVASWQVIARKLAHEIKNPLTPIQMMVSQLKRYYKGDDKDFANLLDNAQSIITEEVSSLRRMVDSFSNFARLPVPEMKIVEIDKTCKKVVSMQQAAFPDMKITFVEPTSSRDSHMAKIDEGLIKQVLVNLVKNAAEACSSCDYPIEINVALNIENAFYRITVTDNGPGIPQDIQQRIFEAYFTTKHTGPNPGMGLGLAVCQKIALDHGGDLTVESRPSRTQFLLTIPVPMGDEKGDVA